MNQRDSEVLLLEARAAHAPRESDRIDALNELARRLRDGGSERSMALADEALARARALDYPAGITAALRNRGSRYLVRAEYEKAQENYQAGLALAQEHNLSSLEASCRLGLGLLCRKRLDYAGALRQMEAARDRAQAMGDYATEGACWNNLSGVWRELNDLDRALACDQAALAAAEQIGDANIILSSRARILLLRSEREGPEHLVGDLEACRREASAAGNTYLQAHLLAGLADMYLQLTRIEEALRANESSLVLARDIRDRQLEMRQLLSLGRICEMLGLSEPAEAALWGAAERAREAGDQELYAEVLAERAAFRERLGDWGGARAFYRELAALVDAGDAPRRQAEAQTGLARVEEAEKREMMPPPPRGFVQPPAAPVTGGYTSPDEEKVPLSPPAPLR